MAGSHGKTSTTSMVMLVLILTAAVDMAGQTLVIFLVMYLAIFLVADAVVAVVEHAKAQIYAIT